MCKKKQGRRGFIQVLKERFISNKYVIKNFRHLGYSRSVYYYYCNNLTLEMKTFLFGVNKIGGRD